MIPEEAVRIMQRLKQSPSLYTKNNQALDQGIAAVHATEKMREKIEKYQSKHPICYDVDITHIKGPESLGIITNEIERLQERLKEDADFYIICEMAKAYMEGLRPTYEDLTADRVQEYLDRRCQTAVANEFLIAIGQNPKCLEKPEILYSAMIPMEPKTKKNSQKIITNPKTKRPMIIQGDAFKQYEQEAGWFLKRPHGTPPIAEPVNIRCLFYRKTRRRVDLTNLLEAIDDILVKYRIIADDDFEIIAGHDGSRVLIDKDNPRTEVYIEKINRYN